MVSEWMRDREPLTHHIRGLRQQQSDLAIEALRVAQIYSYAHSIFVLVLVHQLREIWLCIRQLYACQSEA